MTNEEILLSEIRDMRKEQQAHARDMIDRLARVETTLEPLPKRIEDVEADVSDLKQYRSRLTGAYGAAAIVFGFCGAYLKSRLFGHS